MGLTLIEKIEISGVETYFYDGIDFEMIKNHKGEGDFIIFFVDNYVSEIKKWERDSRLESILNGTKFENFDSDTYRNNSIAIYQTSGNLIPVYETIKKKILNDSNSVFPYKITTSSKK